MTNIIKYIENHKSMINYDMEYSKAAYKYVFKVFYKQANKKDYKSQILILNI